MKLQIELTEEQLQLLISALEINFRMMMPWQGNIVADMLIDCPSKKEVPEDKWDGCFSDYITRRECAGYNLDALQRILYGNQYNADVPKDKNRLSDMWSALRHIQYQLHPHDGYDTRKVTPFKMSDYPMIKVELLEER